MLLAIALDYVLRRLLLLLLNDFILVEIGGVESSWAINFLRLNLLFNLHCDHHIILFLNLV